jgi:type II secretory pathway component PulK
MIKKIFTQLPELYRYRQPDKPGFLLIFVLWVLCTLSIFAFYLGASIQQKLVLVKRINDDSSLRLIAQTGIKQAIWEIIKDDLPISPIDSFSDSWAINPQLFKEAAVGPGKFDISYPQACFSGISKVYGIEDEQRKININFVNNDVLQNLLTATAGLDISIAQNIAAAIIDFRDPDSDLFVPQSAENLYYIGLTEPYNCKNNYFEVIEELLLVKGMTREIFDKIKYFVTIYGNGKVNINTASEVILTACGLTFCGQDIINSRAGEDGQVGTADDKLFFSINEVLDKVEFTSDTAKNEFNAAAGLFSCSSQHFLIRAQASLNYSKTIREFACWVDRTGKILRWQDL